MQSIGSLYLGLRTTTFMHRAYSTVFLLRRLLYAVITVTCLQNPNICIHVFLLSNLIYLTYFGIAQAHDTPISRRIEYFNEVGLQVTTYHLALFPLVSLKDEEIFGWSMIGCIGAVFATNLIIIIIITLVTVKRKLYLKKLKKAQDLNIKKF